MNEKYFASARRNMVVNQLMPNSIRDKAILDAMLNTPRHKFFESKWKEVAYTDSILPLLDHEMFVDDNRYILPPLVFAKMLQSADVNSESMVLDVGCNTCYSSVVISKIAREVVAIDMDKRLLKFGLSQILLMKFADNIAFDVVMDFKQKQHDVKFDVIFINGILDTIPQFIKQCLKQNGSLVLIEKENNFAKAVKYTKDDNGLIREELFNVDADDRLNIQNTL
jgi:protein-L-isoaspartate(D-aspartate) O-methyltransferase